MDTKRDLSFWLLFLVLLTGALLRFYNYAGWSLSNDELSAMARLQFSNLTTMIREGVMLNDMHPPGVQVFLWFWTHIFGTSVALYRLPFVLAGCLSIMVFYQIGFRWFGKPAALVSTAVFSGLSYFVLYSQLARPYSFGVLFSLLFVLAWTELLLRNDRTAAVPETRYKLIFVIAGAAAMYTHYFSFLFVGIVGLSGFFFITSRKQLQHYLFLGMLMFLLYLPAFPVAYYQFSIGGLGGPEGWLGPPGKDAIQQFLFYAFNESHLLIVALILIFMVTIRATLSSQQKLLRFMALVWSMLPVLIAYYYSLKINPVFQYSILIFGFPFLILFITAGFHSSNNRLLSIVVLIVLFLSSLSMIAGQHFYIKAQFAVFLEIAGLTKAYSDKFGNDNIEKTISVISPFYIDYYLDPLAPGSSYSLYHANSAPDLRLLDSIASNSSRAYFLHAWSNVWHSMETEQIIRTHYPYLVEQDRFFNAGLLVYSKTGSPNQLQEFLLDTVNTFENNLWKGDEYYRTDNLAYAGKGSMHLLPANEYSSGMKLNVAQAGLKKGRTIEVDLMAFSHELNKETMLVVSVENQTGAVLWRARPLNDFAVAADKWQHVYFAYTVTEDISPTDTLSVYIWNNGKCDFSADNFRIRVR